MKALWMKWIALISLTFAGLSLPGFAQGTDMSVHEASLYLANKSRTLYRTVSDYEELGDIKRVSALLEDKANRLADHCESPDDAFDELTTTYYVLQREGRNLPSDYRRDRDIRENLKDIRRAYTLLQGAITGEDPRRTVRR